VGGDGLILHFNGQVWTQVAGTGVSGQVRGLWSSNPNDLWVLMDQGIRRFDGSTWTSIAGAPAFIVGIHGTSATDVWVTARRRQVISTAPPGRRTRTRSRARGRRLSPIRRAP
jgi:hypothetical protein